VEFCRHYIRCLGQTKIDYRYSFSQYHFGYQRFASSNLASESYNLMFLGMIVLNFEEIEETFISEQPDWPLGILRLFSWTRVPYPKSEQLKSNDKQRNCNAQKRGTTHISLTKPTHTY